MGVLLANAASLSLSDQNNPASPYARTLAISMQGQVMASAALTPTAIGDDEEDEEATDEKSETPPEVN
jgi:hypothetical protein